MFFGKRKREKGNREEIASEEKERNRERSRGQTVRKEERRQEEEKKENKEGGEDGTETWRWTRATKIIGRATMTPTR